MIPEDACDINFSLIENFFNPLHVFQRMVARAQTKEGIADCVSAQDLLYECFCDPSSWDVFVLLIRGICGPNILSSIEKSETNIVVNLSPSDWIVPLSYEYLKKPRKNKNDAAPHPTPKLNPYQADNTSIPVLSSTNKFHGETLPSPRKRNRLESYDTETGKLPESAVLSSCSGTQSKVSLDESITELAQETSGVTNSSTNIAINESGASFELPKVPTMATDPCTDAIVGIGCVQTKSDVCDDSFVQKESGPLGEDSPSPSKRRRVDNDPPIESSSTLSGFNKSATAEMTTDNVFCEIDGSNKLEGEEIRKQNMELCESAALAVPITSLFTGASINTVVDTEDDVEDDLAEFESDGNSLISTSDAKLGLNKFAGLGCLKQFKPILTDPSTLSNAIIAPPSSSVTKVGLKGWDSDTLPLIASPSSSIGTILKDIIDEDINEANKNTNVTWMDCDICVLCHRSEATRNGFGSITSCNEGRLLSLPCSSLQNSAVHVNCLLWSSGVLETGAGCLKGTAAAIKRGSYTTCSYCGEKGATVGCELKFCKHVYHLPCAIAAGCSLIELEIKDVDATAKINSSGKKRGRKKKTSDGPRSEIAAVSSNAASTTDMSAVDDVITTATKRNNSELPPGTRRTIAFCSEHAYSINSLNWGQPGIDYTICSPAEPMREIVIDMEEWMPYLVVFAENIVGAASKANAAVPENPTLLELAARLLVDRRCCLRAGALTIHSVGVVALDSPWFHQCDILFPVGFESTRLFWSYKDCMKRTLYRFDIMSSDSLYFDDDFQGALAALLRTRDAHTMTFDAVLSLPSEDNTAMRTVQEILASKASNTVLPSSLPVFRVVAMDDESNPFLALSIEECYMWMRRRVTDAMLAKTKGSSLRAVSDEEQLDPSLSVKFHGRRSRRSGGGTENVRTSSTKDVRVKALMFFGLGLHVVRCALEINRDSVLSMLPSLCFPNARYMNDAVVAERDTTINRLQTVYHVSGGEVPKFNTISTYRPSFVLPQRFATVEVLRRVVFMRSAKYNSSIYTETCSRSRGYSGRRYGGGADDDKSEFSALTSAASQLLSSNKSRSGDKKSGHSLSKRAAEDESAGIFEMLSSPKARDISGDDSFPEPGVGNMSAERLQAKLERDYWVMHDNNINEVEKHLAVQRSGIHGWGIYAQRDFAPNSMIVEYVGEQIRHTLADRREIEYERETGLSGSCYLFRLDKDLVVDATHVGGMARFLNHCCEPSCYAYVVTTGKHRPQSTEEMSSPGGGLSTGCSQAREEQKHIVIMAGRHIKVSLLCFISLKTHI